jgi:hypothetical protein
MVLPQYQKRLEALEQRYGPRYKVNLDDEAYVGRMVALVEARRVAKESHEPARSANKPEVDSDGALTNGSSALLIELHLRRRTPGGHLTALQERTGATVSGEPPPLTQRRAPLDVSATSLNIFSTARC